MLRNFLSAPKLEDPEQNDAAAQLWTVVSFMTILSAIYVVVWIALVPEYSFRIVFALPFFLLFGWLFHLLRKGHIKLAAIILVTGIWTLLFIATSFSGGVLAPGYSGLLLTVLAAGIFLGREWALRFAWLSALSGAVLVFLDRQGKMPPASQFTDSTTMWIAQVIYFFVGASLLKMATTRISQSFQRAQHEIEERKKAESALRDAELLYRTLVERTSVVIYRDSAAEGTPSMYISPQIKDMIGYTAEEFTSSPEFWQTLLHPDDKQQIMDGIHNMLIDGENYTSEYRLRAKNGDWVWVRDEAVLIHDEQGNPLYVQGVYVNITDQKRASEQREELIRELEAKNAELERFTYTVSHDLKAPVITIGGFLGLLEKDALNGNANRLKEDILRISEANQKMQRLLNELLELSRIGRKMNPPEKVPFGQIVSEAFTRAESQLNRKKIEVMAMTDLPVIYGDRNRLIEVVQNLLDNAAKFMGNQPNPVIEIGAGTKEDEVVFFVRDNGIGIDPKFNKKIFELFDKLNPQIEGTGIGLALVKRIIEVHGGRIWVESQLGQGATFYFTLPGMK